MGAPAIIVIQLDTRRIIVGKRRAAAEVFAPHDIVSRVDDAVLVVVTRQVWEKIAEDDDRSSIIDDERATTVTGVKPLAVGDICEFAE